jgi:anti-anti-sigma factor
MAIEIQQEAHGATRLLVLSGRLDTETAVDVELALQDLLDAGQRHFLLDLTGIGYVSSAGLRVLLGLAKQLDGGKGSVRLCGLSPAVRQVFDVAGFSKLFPIFPDRAAALGGQAVRERPEITLAKRVAELLGVNASAPSPSPEIAELARQVARRLGLQAATKPAPAPAAPERRPAPAARPPAASGWVDRLRRLFGRQR